MEIDRLHRAAGQTVRRDELLERISLAYAQLPADKRLIVGVAGAPASGKSTLAESLVKQINTDMPDISPAVVVPMDGFHLDNAILDERDLRAVKGAPQTFNVVGLLKLLERLSKPVSTLSSQPVSVAPGGSDADHVSFSEAIDLSAETLYIPLFDRAMDLARANACTVEPRHRLVIVEGNYLLLNRPIWRELAAYMDISVLLDVPLPTLEDRLINRWVEHGFEAEVATKRALSNDIPNARLVILESTSAHLVIESVR